MKVAVIGSGLAGLNAAWLLSQKNHFDNQEIEYDVHLFERAQSIGMDAASVDILNGKSRVDVPMRGFFPGYYPTLVRLYRLLGIEFKKRNHTVMFCRMDEATKQTFPIFSYRNILKNILGFGFPIPDFHGGDASNVLRLTYDWSRFFYRAHQYVRYAKEGKGHLLVSSKMTLAEYLAKNGYSSTFINDSLYAMLTGICTCPYEDCEAYPATIILEFYGSGVLFEGTSAVSGGVQRVCQIMSKLIPHIHLGQSIKCIDSYEEEGQVKVQITKTSGEKEIFDYVIIASQANHALDMLSNPTPEEKSALSSFKYVQTPTYVHTDKRVMATDRKYWRGLNVVANSKMNSAMSTMYMNDITPEIGNEIDIFQTVLPALTIDTKSIISVTPFERVVVNQKSVAGLKLLGKIQGKRNIFFVGSYAFEGIPLLEGCVCSALTVAEKLGVNRKLVFKSVPEIKTYRDTLWAKILFYLALLFSWFLDIIF